MEKKLANMNMKIKISLVAIFLLLFVMNFPSSFAAGDVEFSNLRPVDFLGTRLYSIQLGQQAQFTADIQNNQDIAQNFAYVVTTDDLQNQVKWITGQLEPGQTMSPAISFSFDTDKAYQVDAYLTLLPQYVLDENDQSDYSPFAKSENHLASPLNVSFTTGGSITYAQAPQLMIPDWVRNTAGWWSQTQISDQDFAKGLEYLIKEGVIIVPEGAASEGQAEPQIPSWLRKNAGWWSQGLLSDDEFLKSIQWMIDNGFVKI